MVENASTLNTNNQANSNNNSPIQDNGAPRETAKWTRYLPEAFGIQENIRQSSYRWCAREGGIWGIGTATAMSLHRMRMGTNPKMAGHVFFGTLLVVMVPSYYFCYKRREHKEKVIEMMMKYNQFEHATEMPAEPPLEEHPFWQKIDENNVNNNHNNNNSGNKDSNTKYIEHERELHGMIKERKAWQKPQDQSMKDVFSEKR